MKTLKELGWDETGKGSILVSYDDAKESAINDIKNIEEKEEIKCS